jgi:hypothetical protein
VGISSATPSGANLTTYSTFSSSAGGSGAIANVFGVAADPTGSVPFFLAEGSIRAGDGGSTGASGVFAFSPTPYQVTGDGTLDQLADLALDSLNVYFIDRMTNGIYVAPKASDSPTSGTQISTGSAPAFIAVGNDSSPYVYWTNSNSSSVARVSTMVATNTPETVVATLSASGYTPTPYGLAVDPTPEIDGSGHAHSILYFTDYLGKAVYRVVMTQ